MKSITVLGSTGSVGRQTLDVIRKNPDKFCVHAVSCRSNIGLLAEQIEEFKPELAVVGSPEAASQMSRKYPETEILWGPEGLVTAAEDSCDLLVNSLLGISGLIPTYHAIEAGRDVALANKETLVAGGQVIMDKVKEKGTMLLPVDSEHNAIFQCLRGNSGRTVDKILLTASGGPFRGYSLSDFEQITPEQALKHPKWTMGSKITIDSATLMNKGFEVIEARWLFDVAPKDICIVVHPQSIVHSMVQFGDHSVIAQLGIPDMRIPIGYTLNYPDELPNNLGEVDLFDADSTLTFEAPDLNVFRCGAMAYEALKMGGTYAVVLNAANEVLVQMFLEQKIRFIDIQNNIAAELEGHNPLMHPDIEDIVEVDREVRRRLTERLNKDR